jgi:hypothetical protein
MVPGRRGLGMRVPGKMVPDKLVFGTRVLDKLGPGTTAGTVAPGRRIAAVGSRRWPSCIWESRWRLGRKAPGTMVLDKRGQVPDKMVLGKRVLDTRVFDTRVLGRKELGTRELGMRELDKQVLGRLVLDKWGLDKTEGS